MPIKGPVKQNKKLSKIAIIVLSISLNMCFGCSKVPSHRDGSLEYPQHMFWLRNKKNKFHLRTLIWGLAYIKVSMNLNRNLQLDQNENT